MWVIRFSVSIMIYQLENTVIGVFSLHLPSDRTVKQTKKSTNQEAFSSAVKNTGLILEPYCTWKFDPTTVLGVMDIPDSSRVILWQMSSQGGSQNNNVKDMCLIWLPPTFFIYLIFQQLLYRDNLM